MKLRSSRIPKKPSNGVKLAFKKIELRSAHPWKLARTESSSVFEVVLVELRTAEGFVGWGEAAPVSRYQESAQTVQEFLTKVNPERLNPAALSESSAYLNAISPADFAAKCAINTALLDLAAKEKKQPIYDFLGLGFKERKHVTSFTIGIDIHEVVRSKVIAAEEFPILKMKVGVTEDHVNLKALREVAPQKKLRVDANEGWKTKEEALQAIEWLAKDGNIEFVEQPMPSSVPAEDWVWLKQRSPLPIFADESYHSARDIRVAAECFHGVNVKLGKAGGVLNAMEALKTARRARLKTMLGCMIETSVLISAAAHLAELCDYLDLDGNLLISNDPYQGVTAEKGILSFAQSPEQFGLRVARKNA